MVNKVRHMEENQRELLEAIYNGVPTRKLYTNYTDSKYEQCQDELDLPTLNTFVPSTQYVMPDEYKNMDIEKYLYSLCETTEQSNRVYEELILFNEANSIDFIKYMKYLVDTMKSYNIVWGVGRGSSISVYIFYLIGIHKVDCLKYNIDYTDFFKYKE